MKIINHEKEIEKMSNYDYYEDYYGDEGGFVKNRNHKQKKKFKGKGHQSRKSESERWSEIIEANDEYFSYADEKAEFSNNAYTKYRNSADAPTKSYGQNNKSYDQRPSEPKKFVANPDTTKNIKGVDIDFSGVVAMAKEDSDAKGYKTYGIRFTFKGSKGLYRIVWFNKNLYLRDKIYDEKKAYWESLQNGSGENA